MDIVHLIEMGPSESGAAEASASAYAEIEQPVALDRREGWCTPAQIKGSPVDSAWL